MTPVPWLIWVSYLAPYSLHKYLYNQSILLLRANVFKFAGWVPNRVDPDQTPRSAASDLGLPCLLSEYVE